MFCIDFFPPLLEEHTKVAENKILKKLKFGIMNLGHNEYFCEIHSVKRNSFVECLGYRRNPPYDRHSASWQQKDIFWDLALESYIFLTKMWYSARWTYTVYPEQAAVVRGSVPVTIAMTKHNLRREEFISANDLWATVQGS